MFAALPVLFVRASSMYSNAHTEGLHSVSILQGISQTLIIARIGISRFVSSREFHTTIIALTHDNDSDGCDADIAQIESNGVA
jgi:hypothetical protein